MRALLSLCLLAMLLPGSNTVAAPKVVSSIQPIHAIVTEVMRGISEPTVLLPAGASPHSYTMKPSQARKLSDADVVFWVGPSLETFMRKPLNALARDARHIALIEAPHLITRALRGLHHHGDHQGKHEDHGHEDHGHDEDGHDEKTRDKGPTDPHIWLDPRNAASMASHVVHVLSDIDPANAARYQNNGTIVRAQLADLDQDLKARLMSHTGLRFVTFHDAFQYFEGRYALESAGVIALNPETPPGARRIRELMHEIEDSGATCIFFEPQFSGSVAIGLSEATGVPYAVLDPIGPATPSGLAQYVQTLNNMVDSINQCIQGE